MSRINKNEVQINMSKEIYKLKKDWPERVYIQCGARGVVISKKGGYRTAFLEAFPLDTFIRGESGRLEENNDKTTDELLTIAEEKAWSIYQRYLSCENDGGHDFERLRDDGYGKCKKCGISKSNVLPNIKECWVCKKSPAFFEFQDKENKENRSVCLEHYHQLMNKYDFLDLSTYYKYEKSSIFSPFFNDEGKIEIENKEIMVLYDLSLKATLLESKLKDGELSELSYEDEFDFHKKSEKNFDKLMRLNSEVINLIYKKIKEVDSFTYIVRNKENYFTVHSFIEENIFEKDLSELFLYTFLEIKSNPKNHKPMEFMLIKIVEKMVYNLPKLKERIESESE